jgi:hypothetical protein
LRDEPAPECKHTAAQVIVDPLFVIRQFDRILMHCENQSTHFVAVVDWMARSALGLRHHV